ncbi:MAG: Crp/Fnr family transcriptional regulator [Cyclobacteriaceae bacterium]|nr:Crp/Fnr family transcriptional regulator [Cyclobacteriaceae bacterium]
MENLIDEAFSKSQLEPKLVQEIITIGRLRKVKAGQEVISPGSQSTELPFVVSGTLRVMRQDADGNEIILYYLEGGETCAMSITCCIENKKSEIRVVSEEDAVLWMVPVGYMDTWIQKYPSFRRFVFGAYQARFDEMLFAFDSVAFMKMDERLYKYLLDKKQATGSYVINKTHEQIARELNTSRVVVSRLLKQMETDEKIEQHRNRIEIL